jgi:hypothetical protein
MFSYITEQYRFLKRTSAYITYCGLDTVFHMISHYCSRYSISYFTWARKNKMGGKCNIHFLFVWGKCIPLQYVLLYSIVSFCFFLFLSLFSFYFFFSVMSFVSVEDGVMLKCHAVLLSRF